MTNKKAIGGLIIRITEPVGKFPFYEWIKWSTSEALGEANRFDFDTAEEAIAYFEGWINAIKRVYPK